MGSAPLRVLISQQAIDAISISTSAGCKANLEFGGSLLAVESRTVKQLTSVLIAYA